MGPIVISSMKWPSPTSKWKTPRTSVEQAIELLAEAGEVRGVDRGLDDARTCPLSPSHRLTVLTWATTTKSASRPRLRPSSSRRGWQSVSAQAPRWPISCRRSRLGELDIRCVATSLETEQAARELGLPVEPFETLDRLDLAIDGADQVAPDGWLVKGGGAAQTREKIVAAAADRFVVVVSSNKIVERLAPPVPLELFAFGLQATLRALGNATLRDTAPTPDGGRIADYTGDVGDPARLAARLDAEPGVVSHGLFAPSLVSLVLVGRGDQVERRDWRGDRMNPVPLLIPNRIGGR